MAQALTLELPARKLLPDLDQADPNTGEPAAVAVDMEDFSAANKCACAASDDNPY